jgi:hypothetical protein
MYINKRKMLNSGIDGYLVYEYGNGSRYEGEMRGGKRNGKGISYHKNGSRYEGDHVNNFAEGYGVYYWPRRSKYEGQWKGGK